MPLAAKKLTLIHTAKRALKLSDDQYRLALARAGGVTSAKDLDDQGFVTLMAVFERLGFKSTFGEKCFGNLRHATMASAPQVGLIRELWFEVTDGEGTDAGLDKWISRFGPSSLRFLTREDAPRVIGALLSWRKRKARKAAGGGGGAAA